MRIYILFFVLIAGMVTDAVSRNRIYPEDYSRGIPFRPQPYPSDSQIQSWENDLQDGDIASVYKVFNQLFELPDEPWPEPIKKVLLDIINDHYINRKWETFPRKYLVHEGNDYLLVLMMASWQEDARFATFLGENLAGHNSAAIGLSKIGKPAFASVIKGLYQDEPVAGDFYSPQKWAAMTLELMFYDRLPFLEENNYREQVTRGLLYAVLSKDVSSRRHAIKALKYIDDPFVVRFLEYISRHDKDVVYAVRVALWFIREGRKW